MIQREATESVQQNSIASLVFCSGILDGDRRAVLVEQRPRYGVGALHVGGLFASGGGGGGGFEPHAQKGLRRLQGLVAAMLRRLRIHVWLGFDFGPVVRRGTGRRRRWRPAGAPRGGGGGSGGDEQRRGVAVVFWWRPVVAVLSLVRDYERFRVHGVLLHVLPNRAAQLRTPVVAPG